MSLFYYWLDDWLSVRGSAIIFECYRLVETTHPPCTPNTEMNYNLDGEGIRGGFDYLYWGGLQYQIS